MPRTALCSGTNYLFRQPKSVRVHDNLVKNFDIWCETLITKLDIYFVYRENFEKKSLAFVRFEPRTFGCWSKKADLLVTHSHPHVQKHVFFKIVNIAFVCMKKFLLLRRPFTIRMWSDIHKQIKCLNVLFDIAWIVNIQNYNFISSSYDVSSLWEIWSGWRKYN